MERLMFALTFLSALGAGLVAGIFFAFSAFIMSALGRLSPAGGISAMQSINVVVLNPLFFAVFFRDGRRLSRIGDSRPHRMVRATRALSARRQPALSRRHHSRDHRVQRAPQQQARFGHSGQRRGRGRVDAVSVGLDRLESCTDGRVPCRGRFIHHGATLARHRNQRFHENRHGQAER